MALIPPTIGRIVIYKLSREDSNAINRRRGHAAEHMNNHRMNQTGVMVHVGNTTSMGEEYPATIVRVWDDGKINLKVHLDGSDDYWATSRECGDGDGQWHWMAYQLGQAARAEEAEKALAATNG